MKITYWRPSSVPRVSLVVTALVAIAALASVELLKVEKKKPYLSVTLKSQA